MEAKSLSEKIMIDATKQAQLIHAETKKLVEQVKQDGLAKIKAQEDKVLAQANDQKEADLGSYSKQIERRLDLYERQIRQELVNGMFDQIYEIIKGYKKTDLCNWVSKLLSHDDITGTTMVVAKKDYERYLEALSSDKKPTNLDLIKAKGKKENFKLKVDKLGFEEGFILVHDEYDLIFNYHEIIKTNQNALEKKVYEELFGDE